MTQFGSKEPWMAPMNAFLNAHRLQFRNFVEAICNVSPDRAGPVVPPTYATPNTILSRLPPTSTEGFPSLPYLLDQPREFATLVGIWTESMAAAPSSPRPASSAGAVSNIASDTSDADDSGSPAGAFDHVCRSLRAQTRAALNRAGQAERPSGALALKWEALLGHFDRTASAGGADRRPSTSYDRPSAPLASGRLNATEPLSGAAPPVPRRSTTDPVDHSGNTSAVSLGTPPAMPPAPWGVGAARRFAPPVPRSDRTEASTPPGSSTTGTATTVSTSGAAAAAAERRAASTTTDDETSGDDSDVSPGGQHVLRRPATSAGHGEADSDDEEADDDNASERASGIFPTHALSWDDPADRKRRTAHRPAPPTLRDQYDLDDDDATAGHESHDDEEQSPLGPGRGGVAFGESAATPFGAARLQIPIHPPPLPSALSALAHPGMGARRGSAPAYSPVTTSRRESQISQVPSQVPSSQGALPPDKLRKQPPGSAGKGKAPASPKDLGVGKRFADVFRKKGPTAEKKVAGKGTGTAHDRSPKTGAEAGEGDSRARRKGRRKG